MSYWLNSQDSWILQDEETPYPANEGNPLDTHDLTKLVHLHEPALLHALKTRFANGTIYTLSGSMLLSLNPFKKLEGLYGEDVKRHYRSSTHTNPHIFQVAQKAIDHLKDTRSNQSLLISGESGAGKTVATRIILDYLSNGKSDLNEKILCANPILEAFGNAVTLRNHNSSRFGKYIKVHCDPLTGQITSASIQTYLLEEVRVTSHGDGEGPFHIFTSPSLKSQINGSRYVVPYCERTYDEDGPVWEWMTKMGFSFEELRQVESVVRGIGLLGRVEWDALDDDSSAICNPEFVALIAQTLKVDEARLTYLLTHKTIKTVHETIETNLSVSKAKSSTDAWAGWLYSRLFDWIVKRINEILSFKEDKNPFIGLLDIFGFEVFGTNGLEQLCINYTNERIQALFNHHIFVEEQAEYVREGIDWSDISFPSNEVALSSIHRLLCAITEECMIPRGCDQTFASKLKDDGPITVSAKQKVEGGFEICHYAGPVVYSSEGFCEKNKGDVGKEWMDFAMESLPWLIHKDDDDFSLPNRNKKRDTLLTSFDRNLDHLIETLEGTHQGYVRCLKSNDDLEADRWISPRVADQLRYSGVIEAVKIARLGFPVRYLHADFAKRFTAIGVEVKDVPSRVGTTKVFLKKEWHSTLEERRRGRRDEAATLIRATFKGFQERSTYLKIQMLVKCLQGRWRFLRAKRSSIRLQAMVRMAVWRKRYQQFYWCVVALQKRWTYRCTQRKAVRIQTWWRAIAHRKAFVLLRNLAVRLQGGWRIVKARRFLKVSIRSICLIQRWWRGVQERKGNLEASFYTAALYASFPNLPCSSDFIPRHHFPDLPPSPIQVEAGVQTEVQSEGEDEPTWDTIIDFGLERQVEELSMEVKLLKAGWKASQESLREMGMRFEPLIQRVGELEEENKRLRRALKGSSSLKDVLVVKGKKWIRNLKK